MMIPLLALLIDMKFGEPPTRFHPVVWMGTLIRALRRRLPRAGKARPLIGGAVLAWGGALLMVAIGHAIQRLLALLPFPLRWLATALLLKTTFSLKGLVLAAQDVETALVMEDLPQARHWVGWHLVSRDTSALSEVEVVAATVESLAENLSDGVIAPLLYFYLGGLPAAFAYRYLNTADAMVGYRTPEYEWLGKVAARTDDVANLLPARLTAFGILGAVLGRTLVDFAQFDPTAIPHLRIAWHIYHRDHALTASPNAGHPMSAMAGALGIQLEKTDHYTLGTGLAVPRTHDIRRAIHVLYVATALTLGVGYGIHYATRYR